MIKGHPRAFQVLVNSGAGGATNAAARPPQGELWLLKAASVTHDDVAHTMYWQHVDIQSGLTATFYEEALVAGTTRHSYHRDVGNQSDVLLTYDNYLNYSVALAANKNIVLNVLVERIVGVRTPDEGE